MIPKKKIEVHFYYMSEQGSHVRYCEFNNMNDASIYMTSELYHFAFDTNYPIRAELRNIYDEVLVEANNVTLFNKLHKKEVL